MKTMKRSKGLALLTTVALLVSTICLPTAAAAADTPDLTGVTAFVWDGDSVTVIPGSDANYEVVAVTTDDQEWEAAATAHADGSTTYTLPQDTAGELQVGIKKKGGSYVFSGEGTGSIVVKKEASADAVLYLNGLTLTSAFTGLITVNKDSTATCTIHAVAGTVNTLTDNAANNDETNAANLLAENAVIKGKAGSTLVLTGGGTLNVAANGKNGIKANNLLTIEEGLTLNIDAPDNAISSENAVTINGGTIHVTTREGDGIKAAADDQPVGSVTINGGTLTIDSCGDAIQATASVIIHGGTFTITACGGYDAVYDKDDDAYPSAKGIKASGSYTVTDEDTGAETEVDATECELVITGGAFVINTPDDAIHSDQNLTITGGTFTICTGDDAIHAEYVTTLGERGGANDALIVKILACCEGIEGATVNIYSGAYRVYSTDDAINAANADLQNHAYAVNVYGGNLYCAASAGDCLDSNGNLNLLGGTVVALGSIAARGESNTALDCDGSLVINGATVLAVGSSDMAAVPAGNSQAYVTWTSAGSSTASSAGGGQGGFQPSGTRPGQGGFGPGGGGFGPGQGGQTGFITNNTKLTITDAAGAVLLEQTAYWDAANTGSVGYVLFSSPDVTAGSVYTLTTAAGDGDPTDPNEPAETPADTPSDTSPVGASSDVTSNVSSDTPTTAERLRGDINGDNSVDASDALMVLKCAVGKTIPTQAQFHAGDVTNDHTLDARDALYILQYAVGKITSFS